jgi:hypothetical protein
MGERDRSDDRQPEAGAAVGADAVLLEPAERLEDRLQLVRRDHRPGVGHQQLGPAVVGPGGNPQLTAIVVVPDRVLHQVLYEPFDQDRVAGGRGGAGVAVDGDGAVGGLRCGLVQYVPYDVGQVERCGAGDHVLAAGQGEQAVDEPLVPAVDDQQRFAEAAYVLGGVRAAYRDVHERPVDRQRGAQLVRGVRDEAALAVERPGQPFQHRVEGVGQLLDVVAGPRVRDPFGEVVAVRHPARGVGDRVDGTQRAVGQQPAQPERRHAHHAQRDAALGQQRPHRLGLVDLAALDEHGPDLPRGDVVVGRGLPCGQGLA